MRAPAVRSLRAGDHGRFQALVRDLALELDLLLVAQASEARHLDHALRMRRVRVSFNAYLFTYLSFYLCNLVAVMK